MFGSGIALVLGGLKARNLRSREAWCCEKTQLLARMRVWWIVYLKGGRILRFRVGLNERGAVKASGAWLSYQSVVWNSRVHVRGECCAFSMNMCSELNLHFPLSLSRCTPEPLNLEV